jgi:RNA-directed DNA polymerase
MSNRSLIHALARAFVAGEPSIAEVVGRAAAMLGRQYRWLWPLAERYVSATAGRTRPRHRDVVAFLLADPGFKRASSKPLSVSLRLTEPQQMQPVAAAAGWDVPVIESAGALAEWLHVTPGELDWFADLKGLGYKRGQPLLHHYHYRFLPKSYRGVRLIEEPKTRLKEMQSRILSVILDRIPPHTAVHGFVKGRSIRTFAAPHVGRRVVLKMDLQDFFPSFAGVRIQALFRTTGYPEPVADLLGGICTNAVPRHAWRAIAGEISPSQLNAVRTMYARPHLPQGAPTSPALANLCTYRTDCRLSGLAKSAGAVYTRYADDLAFSGDDDFDRRAERFSAHVAAILHEEGLAVNHRKTRVMRRGVRQRLAGVVANERLNVARVDFDRLKAILTNCVRQGPESQNRDAHPSFRAHLEGRVGFVESINPVKGRRLRAILEAIEWR